ncbi:MAG: Fur family transcriptional regulator [Pseudomonadota bacterium]
MAAVKTHDHSKCVDDALRVAEQLCAKQGLRLTPLRRRVLQLVWASHRPVGAYEVLESLPTSGKRAAPPTVYRALEFLMEAGLVHRLDSLNAYVGCPDPGEPHSGQFLICRQCRHVTEIDASSVNAKVRAIAADNGFTAEQQVLEVKGICADCQP